MWETTCIRQADCKERIVKVNMKEQTFDMVTYQLKRAHCRQYLEKKFVGEDQPSSIHPGVWQVNIPLTGKSGQELFGL